MPSPFTAAPRAAGDIEPWIRAEPSNARNVWNALSDFGTPLRDIHPGDSSQPGIVFQTGVPSRRIDILTVFDGPDFEEAWRDRLDIVVEGLALPILSRPHFLRNKKASGRPEDLAVIALLSEAGRNRPSGP